MHSLTRWLTSIACAILLWSGFYSPDTGWGWPLAQAAAAPSLASSQIAYLPPGNAITDGEALLRYGLPIDNQDIRKIQEDLEGLSEWLRSKRWGPIKRDVSQVRRTISRRREAILADIPESERAEAAQLLDEIDAGLAPIETAVDNRDREAVWLKRAELLDNVTLIEEKMVQGFPFEVPEEYSHLPQLKGRATIEFETNKGSLTAVVDGYNAPVTAGNFVDLVQRGFYDDMPFIRAEDYYVLQTGDPEGPEEGFIDPESGEYRAIPLEIRVKGEAEPVYGNTLESLGMYLDEPVLPFSAFGTLGMARPQNDPNGASSQFFFFLFEPDLTPAGLNLLDGRYAVFGYVVENEEVLEKITQGDRIISARVVSGLENLEEPQST